MADRRTNYINELHTAIDAAVLAGGAIMGVYSAGDFAVEFKKDSSPLTRADRRANEIIVSMLRDKFPDYAILAEESEDDMSRLDNDYCFIVDPLDGTKEFIKRNDQFTVNIALAYKRRAVMGVIYIPVTKELYYAMEGGGAFYRADGAEPVQISVSDRTDDIRMVRSLSHESEELDRLIEKHNISNCIRIGSAVKGCLIARGEADVYYRYGPTMEWDTAAMQCIVEQAGGIFRQMDGAEMLYNRRNPINDKGFYIVNRAENVLE